MPGAPVHAAERRLVRRLRESGALNPGSAEKLDGLWGPQRRRLSHLVAHGVIHEPAPATYYLDEDAWDAYVGRQRLRALIMLGAVAIIGLVFYALSAAGR